MPNLPISQHPLRNSLNHELHARPPLPIAGPCWISHLSVLHEGNSRPTEEQHLNHLCSLFDHDICPLVEGDHWVLEVQLPNKTTLRLKWEYHNEFSSYTFYLDRIPEDDPATTALMAIPIEWLSAVPGSVIAAAHIEFKQHMGNESPILPDAANAASDMVYCQVADGGAWVFSDFRLHDGYSKFVVIDQGLRPRQAGRTIQRLVEIDTYAMLALLTFPVAKQVSRLLSQSDESLRNVMHDMTADRTSTDERHLLGQLTKLAAGVEESVSLTAFRFGAATAYYRLVQQRIEDLREIRIDGFPPISEFMDRRLAPAINTCKSVAARQQDLSSRIARKSALLRTRVDIALEQQNLELLAQMNRRAHMQLRLQETVEGLSVVVLTYYGSQLIQYLAKGTKDIHHFSVDVITAISIPIIAGLVFWGTRKTRQKLFSHETTGT
jgi:uncharacterized membrane-anchored protein